MFLTIENIPCKEILELRTYRQPGHTRITIVRGYRFWARLIAHDLVSWTNDCTPENAKKTFEEFVLFEQQLGSELQ